MLVKDHYYRIRRELDEESDFIYHYDLNNLKNLYYEQLDLSNSNYSLDNMKYSITNEYVKGLDKIIKDYSKSKLDNNLLCAEVYLENIDLNFKDFILSRNNDLIEKLMSIEDNYNKKFKNSILGLLGVGIPVFLYTNAVSYNLGTEYSTQVANQLNEYSHLLAPISGAVQIIGSLFPVALTSRLLSKVAFKSFDLIYKNITKNKDKKVSKFGFSDKYNFYDVIYILNQVE